MIVTLTPGAKLPAAFAKFAQNRNLDIINGVVLDLPNYVLKVLAAHPDTFQLHYDREIATHNYRTAVTVGARAVQQSLRLHRRRRRRRGDRFRASRRSTTTSRTRPRRSIPTGISASRSSWTS